MKFRLLLFSLFVITSFSLKLTAQVTASFSTGFTLGCEPFCVNLKNDTIDPAASYVWNFGDGTGTAYNNKNLVHCYNYAGTFTITLVASKSGFPNDTATKSVTVLPRPEAKFTASIINNNVVGFTESSTISSWSIDTWDWDFGDGTTSTEQNPGNHIYSAIGTYTVQLLVTSSTACKDTTSHQVTITAVSIDELENATYFSIFPNPFSSTTTIQLEKDVQGGTLTIYDALGNKVKEITEPLEQTIIDRNDLTSGVYFVVFADKEKVSTIKKLVITDN